jgi:hypothetical protein
LAKAEAALATMTPEQLIEGFVRETKLWQLGTVRKRNEALKNKIAFADEIVRRGGVSSLIDLMGNSDPFIAYSAADQVADLTEFRERALVVLDRIADGRLGSVSGLAQTARNVIRFGSPNGDPSEYEKRLAAIRAREDRA